MENTNTTTVLSESFAFQGQLLLNPIKAQPCNSTQETSPQQLDVSHDDGRVMQRIQTALRRPSSYNAQPCAQHHQISRHPDKVWGKRVRRDERREERGTLFFNPLLPTCADFFISSKVTELREK